MMSLKNILFAFVLCCIAVPLVVAIVFMHEDQPERWSAGELE